MRTDAGPSLRDATPADLPAIAALREAAGWAAHPWALRAVVGQPYATCVVAVDDSDQPIAVGSGIDYRPIGFIGNMIVAEAHRRRGIGSAILDAVSRWLEAAGCRRLELNATSEGRPLYERHRFSSTGDSATARIGREVALAPDASVVVRAAARTELDALAAFDRPRFGGDRRPLLAELLSDAGTSFLIAERGGELVGYAGMRHEGPRVGPFLADDPTAAETLLAAAFRHLAAVELRLNLPPGNVAGAAWLRGLGVSVEPWDGRMARGPAVPRRPETLYGMTVGALG